jgi:SAM-dependent methyltransferase
VTAERRGPHVDYRAAASRYATGRALPDDKLARWGRAVATATPVAHPRVADVGAGTGIFSRAWVGWGAAAVVAVEPVAAMRVEAVARDPADVHHVAGTAEELPLREAAVDVAWLSTVIHHVMDRSAALAELHRVVAPGGVVHLRGLCPDRSRVTTLAYAPPAAAERAVARFPTAAELTEQFGAAGFRPAGAAEVEEFDGVTGVEAAAWVERMRDADSMLGAFTPDEVEATKRAMAAEGDTQLPPSRLTLLTFGRAG